MLIATVSPDIDSSPSSKYLKLNLRTTSSPVNCSLSIFEFIEPSSGFCDSVTSTFPSKISVMSFSLLERTAAARIFCINSSRFITARVSALLGIIPPYSGNAPSINRVVIVCSPIEKVAWFSFQSLYAWLIDFLAFNSAHLSLLESEEQIKFVAAKFFVPKKKLLKAWTGVDDSLFYTNPDAKKLPTFTVLFRGAFLPESGVEYAVDAFKILKKHNINLRIIGRGEFDPLVEKRLKEFDSSNVEWIRGKKMPFEDLRRKIQECHISLGQLSNHDRLNRTVPHKAFESIAMKIPYLTARNKGILELLNEDETCFCCNPADAQDLAEKILEIKNNPELMAKVAESAYQLYTREFTPRVLAKRVVDAITIRS